MSKTKFIFRFAVVKRNLLRDKKIAEVALLQRRAELNVLRERLSQQQIEYQNAAIGWGSVLASNPSVSIGSLASLPLEKNKQIETELQIRNAIEECRRAEAELAHAEKKLRSIEEIETMDFAEFEADRVRREENMFRDEILAKWNQE